MMRWRSSSTTASQLAEVVEELAALDLQNQAQAHLAVAWETQVVLEGQQDQQDQVLEQKPERRGRAE